MTKTEVFSIITKIRDYYKRKNFCMKESDEFGMWFAALSKYDYEDVYQGLIAHISNPEKGQYQPNVAELVKGLTAYTDTTDTQKEQQHYVYHTNIAFKVSLKNGKPVDKNGLEILVDDRGYILHPELYEFAITRHQGDSTL